MSKFAFVAFLTLVRAPLALAGGCALLANVFAPSPALLAAGLALLAASAVTDFFDGALARRWRVTSRFGALADPLMDKVFFAATLPVATFEAMYMEDVRHALALLALDVTFVLRDQWLSFLRAVASGRGADVRAAFPGKLRTFLAFPGIMAVHLGLGLQALASVRPEAEGIRCIPRPAMFAVEAALVFLTVWSGILYTRSYMPHLRASCAR
ncbi:MAG: CDP-alcohol phosphatidyltransferase family protein [Kiritimatiellae bacterium]|nr:CDP-alcohol phosphatidyltransferase family protein [Kiritimatiellia bacterium]